MKTTFIHLAARFSLLCYLAVSSIAAVHAFPSVDPVSAGQITTESNSVPASDSMAHCQQMNSEVSTSLKTDSAVSACKVFCSAISNVIANNIALNVPNTQVNAVIAFIDLEFHSPDPRLEKQPPKNS
ncbi:MAG TPA: hypothetical protein DCW52_08295 [Gammaproteobacteria bacterium]|jgi:hypothetical protein|nr:hypothetical protein [Gammaproteobacteria bacterium]